MNITYKILVNDAVAMTGGQPVEGSPTVPQILQQLAAEGVAAPAPGVRRAAAVQGAWPACRKASRSRHRDGMDALQRELRETKGVSVIVYAQTCAAEKRRRRKKKELVDPPKRVVINEEVCEGCGDCGVQSNCVSILPLETPLGPQAQDRPELVQQGLLLREGLLPELRHGRGRRICASPPRARPTPPADLPAPVLPSLEQPCNVVVTGVGGTGVVTIGALLGMAAHLEGKGVLVLDMAGLAQKGGAVMSHVRLAASPAGLACRPRVVGQGADVVLGCDLMVAAGKDALRHDGPKRTCAVLNTDVAPTGAFTQNPDWQTSPEAMLQRVRDARWSSESLDATSIAMALHGRCRGHQRLHARLRLAEWLDSARRGSAAAKGDRTQWRGGADEQGGLRLGTAGGARPVDGACGRGAGASGASSS